MAPLARLADPCAVSRFSSVLAPALLPEDQPVPADALLSIVRAAARVQCIPLAARRFRAHRVRGLAWVVVPWAHAPAWVPPALRAQRLREHQLVPPVAARRLVFRGNVTSLVASKKAR